MDTKATTVDQSYYQQLDSLRGFYRLLRWLFDHEIDKEFLAEASNDELKEALALLNLELPDVNSDCQPWLDQMAAEFAYLFIGPGAHLSPHESVQAVDEGSLNGPQTVAVRRFILLSGFDFEAGNRRYPDHLCSEFEFMECLLAHESNALLEGDQDEAAKSLMLQQEFFRIHLSTWLQKFCDRICSRANLDFYKQLALATAEFTVAESERLIRNNDQLKYGI
jgi:putative dimethyl sulfoxide reductase chaperone